MANRLPDQGYHLKHSLLPDTYGWIEVDGEPLQVFGAEETDQKAVGYIEAKEGQNFVVRFADQGRTPSGTDFGVGIFIDGTRAASPILRATTLWMSPLHDASRFIDRSGRRATETSIQPFLFGKLQTTDSEEDACNDEAIVKNLGTIQLRFCRGVNYRTSTGGTYRTAVPKPIHERAKKAQLSHQATFGESVSSAKPAWGTCDWIDPESSPFFQLEFRYRSRQLLQLEGHIPNSPTPSPEPEVSASPAATPFSPAASASNARRSASAGQNSQSPQVESNEATRLARLQAELESLRRQERIAALQREIDGLQGEVDSNGGGASSSSARKIKAEPSDGQRDAKKVKEEIGEASLSQSTGSSKGKGKEKKKAEVIVLSDSD